MGIDVIGDGSLGHPACTLGTTHLAAPHRRPPQAPFFRNLAV